LKEAIRHSIGSKRLLLEKGEVEKLSRIISEKAFSLIEGKGFNSFMLYYPYRNEVSLIHLFKLIRSSGGRTFFPKVVGNDLMPVEVFDLNELVPGFMSIPEPPFNPDRVSRKVDVVFVPGIAFDLSFCRLGYGGGYYDRFLERVDALKVGVCFDFQIVEKLPCEPFDVRMDVLISEKRKIRRR